MDTSYVFNFSRSEFLKFNNIRALELDHEIG